MSKLNDIIYELEDMESTYCHNQEKCENCPFLDEINECRWEIAIEYLTKINSTCREMREPAPVQHKSNIPATAKQREKIKKTCYNRGTCAPHNKYDEPCPYSYYDEEYSDYMCKYFNLDGNLPCDW